MKNYLLLILLAFELFSCQEELPEPLKEGPYSIRISCNNDLNNYSSDLMIELIKIDEYSLNFMKYMEEKFLRNQK